METEMIRADIKKHLNRGDLKRIAKEMGVSFSTISQVLRGERNNLKILEAIIEKAEQNKAEKEMLLIRTQKL